MITAGDAQRAFLFAMHFVDPTWDEWCTADCNGDSALTAEDAQRIFMTALRLDSCVDTLPPGRIHEGLHNRNSIFPAKLNEIMWIETPSLKSTGEMEFRVMLHNRLTPVDALTMDIAYDAGSMVPDACIPGELDPGFIMFDSNVIEPGLIRVAAFSDWEQIPRGSEGCLAVLKFHLIDSSRILQESACRVDRVYDDLAELIGQAERLGPVR
jgi:hypothetical protein